MKRKAKILLIKTKHMLKFSNTNSYNKPFEEVGEHDDNKPIAFMFGFKPSIREHYSNVFSEYRTLFVYAKADLVRLLPYFLEYEKYVFIIRRRNAKREIVKYAKKKNIDIIWVGKTESKKKKNSKKSKLKKLVRHPIKTFKRYFIDKSNSQFPPKNINKTVAICINFSPWKRDFLREYLSRYYLVFLPKSTNLIKYKDRLKRYKDVVFIIWGYGESEDQLEFINNNGYPIYRMEDGFIRSIGLGANHIKPLSLVIDRQNLYFHSGNTDLKDILNNYPFHENPEILERAKVCIDKILTNKISKYNFPEREIDLNMVYGEKKKRRILVIGQVEDDASIIYGMDYPMTNNELVMKAYEENPDAEIIYRPHPDVLNDLREKKSDPYEVSHIAKIVTEDIPFTQALETIDEVYTMTSLTGFEALLRGIKVTVFGRPFYAGWGLTNDKLTFPERKRKLSILELFAGAYILYPKYYDAITNKETDIEHVIDYITKKKAEMI